MSFKGNMMQSAVFVSLLSALIACGSPTPNSEPLSINSDPLSICGKTSDFIPINRYNGPLTWVQKREGAVGRLNRGCSGTFIGNHANKTNLFITAGHCIEKGGAAKVEFNYEAAPDGPVVTVRGVALESSKNPDYALIRLDSNPGIAPTPIGTRLSQNLAIIQHPGGERKVLAVGKLSNSSTASRIFYSGLDTRGGSSGSGVLDDSGSIIGVHTNGGCSATGGTNAGWLISKIRAASSII
jgi:V8-like Glu-specific endopeptidase